MKDMSDKNKTHKLKLELLEQTGSLITAAFGLVAALAWNDTIKLIFKEILGEANTLGPMIVYAIMVTAIAVILTIIVARTLAKAKTVGNMKIYACKLCEYESPIEAKVLEHMFKEHAASKDKFLIK